MKNMMPEMLSKGLKKEIKDNHPMLVMVIDLLTIISIIYTLFIMPFS